MKMVFYAEYLCMHLDHLLTHKVNYKIIVDKRTTQITKRKQPFKHILLGSFFHIIK